jgi:hypothetical protein
VADPLSIRSCSWEVLVAELGDPFTPVPGVDGTVPRAGDLPSVQRLSDPDTTPLPVVGRGATAASAREAS